MCNNETLTFTAGLSGIGSAQSYSWETTGGLTIGGATTATTTGSSIQVTASAVGWGFGRVYVRANTLCGTSEPRYWDVYVGIPSPNISGPTTTFGSEVIILRANVWGQGVTTYQWGAVNKVTGWRWATATTGSEARIFWETATQSLTVKVTVTNRCGTPMDSHTIQYLGGAFARATVSPNPANQSFTLHYESPAGGDEEVQMALYDFKGEVVQRGKTVSGKADFNTSRLPQGLYTLQLVSNDGTITKRVQVKH